MTALRRITLLFAWHRLHRHARAINRQPNERERLERRLFTAFRESRAAGLAETRANLAARYGKDPAALRLPQ